MNLLESLVHMLPKILSWWMIWASLFSLSSGLGTSFLIAYNRGTPQLFSHDEKYLYILYSHWVHFLRENDLELLRFLLPSLVSSKLFQNSSTTQYRISLLKWFKPIFLPCSVISVTHQDSDWRKFIFLSLKCILPRLTGILPFNWKHSLIYVNLQ